MRSLKTLSKMAGLGYLIIFITGIYANFFVLENLIVAGDAAASVGNIARNDSLFRSGILSFVIMVMFDVFLSWALYLLLEPVNKNVSLLSGWLRLVNSTIFAVALYHLLAILHLVNSDELRTLLDSGQMHAQVMIFFHAFNQTWLVGLVFFGLHLLTLGYLILKSGYIPKIIGILLIVAAFGYLVDSFAHFLLPDYSDYKDIFLMIVVIPGVIGELSLTVWLLLKGVQAGSSDHISIESGRKEK